MTNATANSKRGGIGGAIWPLLLIVVVSAAAIAVLFQRPFNYRFFIGRDEGWHSDLPFVQHWNDPETTGDQVYRWTARGSHIVLPAAATRSLLIDLHLLPTPQSPAMGKVPVALRFAGGAVAMPAQVEARYVAVVTPPGPRGLLDINISSPLFIESADTARELGIAVADFGARSLTASAVLPPLSVWWPLLWLPLAYMLIWLLLRSRLAAFGGTATLAIVLTAMLVADLPRFTLLGGPLIGATLWGYALALGGLELARRLLRRWRAPVGDHLIGRVALIFAAIWILRYTGRLYPEAMRGDVGFHVNRTSDVIEGVLFLVSRHRGINFPYPSGMYVLLLPLAALPLSPFAVVDWMDAFWGAIAVVPAAYLGWVTGCRLNPRDAVRAERLAIFAAAGYALLAPAMMVLYWSFLTHIFAQELSVWLIAGLVAGWERFGQGRGLTQLLAVLVVIFFGHIGLYINVSLLLGLLLAYRWLRSRDSAERRTVQRLLLMLVVAQLLAVLLFYSSYWQLVVDKLRAFVSGGMSAVQEDRPPTSRADLWRSLLVDGLGAHYSWLGLPLALIGGLILWRRLPGQIITTVWWSTLAVAILQSLIPFLTRSTITTRWLSFAAWIVAIGLAILADWLWRRGKVGALVVFAVYGWIGGNTLAIWLKAGGFRIRPIEPF